MNAMLGARDDLVRVGNIRTFQIERLSAGGITTVRALAESKLLTISWMATGTFDGFLTCAAAARVAAWRTACVRVVPTGSDAKSSSSVLEYYLQGHATSGPHGHLLAHYVAHAAGDAPVHLGCRV